MKKRTILEFIGLGIIFAGVFIGVGAFLINIENEKIDWSFPIPQEGKYINATSIEIKENISFYTTKDLPYTYIGHSLPNLHIKLIVIYYGQETIIGDNIKSDPVYLGTVTYEFRVTK